MAYVSEKLQKESLGRLAYPAPTHPVAFSRKKCLVGNVRRSGPLLTCKVSSHGHYQNLLECAHHGLQESFIHSLPGFSKREDQPRLLFTTEQTDFRTKVLRFGSEQPNSNQRVVLGIPGNPHPTFCIASRMEKRHSASSKPSFELVPFIKFIVYAPGHISRWEKLHNSRNCLLGDRVCL